MNLYFRLKPCNVSISSSLFIEQISFDLNQSMCLLGNSGSGKTVFLKKLAQEKCYETNGKVEFCFDENYKVINWRDELSYGNLDTDYQTFCDQFFQNRLQITQKCLIVKKILSHPNYLFCDDFHLNAQDLKCLLEFLESQSIFFFYVTHDIEATLYFPYLMVLKNHQVAIEGKTILVLKEEKIMKVLGYSLPFVINLSIQLKYYGLLEQICFTKEEMEMALWKKN